LGYSPGQTGASAPSDPIVVKALNSQLSCRVMHICYLLLVLSFAMLLLFAVTAQRNRKTLYDVNNLVTVHNMDFGPHPLL